MFTFRVKHSRGMLMIEDINLNQIAQPV